MKNIAYTRRLDIYSFSQTVLLKVRASAINYSNHKYNLNSQKKLTPQRIEIAVRFKCNEGELNQFGKLKNILLLIKAEIKNEKDKAQRNSAFYSHDRHMELHALKSEVKSAINNLPTALKN